MKNIAIALTLALALTACVRDAPLERTTSGAPLERTTSEASAGNSASLVSQKEEFIEWLLIGEEPFLAEAADEFTPEYVGAVIDGVCINARVADNGVDFIDSLTEYFSYDELEDGITSLVVAALLTGCEEQGKRLFGE